MAKGPEMRALSGHQRLSGGIPSPASGTLLLELWPRPAAWIFLTFISSEPTPGLQSAGAVGSDYSRVTRQKRRSTLRALKATHHRWVNKEALEALLVRFSNSTAVRCASSSGQAPMGEPLREPGSFCFNLSPTSPRTEGRSITALAP